MLELQGVGWLTRKAIAMATVTLNITHYKDDSAVEHIDIDQVLTGGIPGTSERRILDWTPREHEDHIFGSVCGKSRRSKVESIDQPFLSNGWLPDTVEHGLIEAYAESNTPKSHMTWNVSQVRHLVSPAPPTSRLMTAQVWGFEQVQGERRYTRHIKFMGPKQEDIEIRLVYDYGLYSPILQCRHTHFHPLQRVPSNQGLAVLVSITKYMRLRGDLKYSKKKIKRDSQPVCHAGEHWLQLLVGIVVGRSVAKTASTISESGRRT